jgi:chemotaxis protein histidine kinase CheA
MAANDDTDNQESEESTPRRRPTTKKSSSTAKKSTQRSTQRPARKSTEQSTEDSGETSSRSSDSSERSSDAPRAAARKRKSGGRIAREGARQLAELTGREVEGVVGFSRSEDGWTVEVEVLELSRIPNTTDVLAIYQLDLDEDGELDGYRRTRRYTRGASGDEYDG